MPTTPSDAEDHEIKDRVIKSQEIKSQEIEDQEITLARGGLHLRVSALGASLRGLWREEADGSVADIITGYQGAKGKVGGQGDALIPFPGRVRAGKYAFEGQSHQMLINDKEVPAAIHGFVRQAHWNVEARSEHEITFAVGMDAHSYSGYPFALHIRIIYTLETDGLTCRFEIENTGATDAPVAAGFHPYFTVGSGHIDADTLHVPFDATLEFADLLPTGRILPVAGTPFDFQEPRAIGETVFNTCFLHGRRDADGLLRLRLAAPGASGESGRALTVWMDAAFGYVVLYSGDPLPDTHRRRALAIEPMTCGTDAFNRPEWGLVTLAPAATFRGAWGVVS